MAALVAVLLIGSAAFGSPVTERVSVTLMFYADALLVVGLPLSLLIAALPVHHRQTRQIAV